MKSVDRRKFFAALHRSAKSRGIDIIENPGAGSGSHGSVMFSDGSPCKPVRLVLVYAREISPGVQRAMVAYLRARVQSASADETERALATKVMTILEECVSR